MLNAPHRRTLNDGNVPDANEEYFLYQTLLGAWEEVGSGQWAAGSEEEGEKVRQGGGNREAHPTSSLPTSFVERIQAYMIKALHESKVHTSWVNPNLGI